MSIPKITDACVSAVFEKAMQRDPMTYVAESCINMMRDEQAELMSAIIYISEGLGEAVAETHPEAEGLNILTAAMMTSTAMLVYEAIKAQIEAKDLEEMFG